LAKFIKKRNNKWKTWKSSDFGGFQWPEMRGQKSQNLPYFHIWFKGCKKFFLLKKWLKICTSFLVYSHIWLNLPKQDPHFIFLVILHLPMNNHHFDYKSFYNLVYLSV
jgi:hypothetical protein